MGHFTVPEMPGRPSSRFARSRASFPTADEELLLQAAVRPGPAGLAAWERLRDRVDPERLDPSTLRLLPLVCDNLLRSKVDDPLLPRLRGVRRRTWLANQMLFAEAAQLIGKLAAAGVPTLLLKGAALVATIYPSPGLRPMGDLDLLVPVQLGQRALAVAQSNRWASRYQLTPHFLSMRHAVDLVSPGHQHCDLHWRLLQESGEDWEEELWAGSIEVQFQGVPTRALGATDQLVHLCAHAMRGGRVRSMLSGLADAALLLEAQPIDWERLVALSRRSGYLPHVYDALALVRRTLDAPVPEPVLAALAATPVSRCDRLEYNAASWPSSTLRTAVILMCDYRRLVRYNRRTAALTFAEYLSGNWALDNVADLPLEFARRLGHRLQAGLRSFVARPA
jgi:putative nucleotidyltransferase-like protein